MAPPGQEFQAIGFSDLLELWVITIKKPMILCARNTSRSREQSTKRRSSSENMRKVCLFHRQNKKTLWLSNMAEIQGEVRKGLWAFFFLTVLFGCWLAELANSDHVVITDPSNTHLSRKVVHKLNQLEARVFNYHWSCANHTMERLLGLLQQLQEPNFNITLKRWNRARCSNWYFVYHAKNLKKVKSKKPA